MNNIHVAPDITNPTHHISLSDGKKTVGLIISDSEGTQSYRSISRAPLTRTAIQTTSGKQKYADLEPPWISIAQEDWSGGRGNEDFTEDSTRYYDSYRCQSSFKEIFNAPLDRIGRGVSKEYYSNYPSPVKWLTIKNVNQRKLFFYFNKPAEAGTEFRFLLRKRGKPTGGIKVTCFKESGGNPITTGFGAKYGETIYQAKNKNEPNYVDDTVSFLAKVKTTRRISGSYVFVFEAESYSLHDYWEIGITDISGNEVSDLAISEAGKPLQPVTDYRIICRIAYNPELKNVKFFTYKQLPFAIVNRGANQAPTVYVCGTIGNADISGANRRIINDASKTWVANQWLGAQVGIVQGNGTEEHVTAWRDIVSNTNNSLTVSSDWEFAHDLSTTYIITGSDLWTPLEPDDHGCTDWVTDVCVVNNIVYFAQGDNKPVRRMKWNQDGTPNSDWLSEDDVMKATYLASVRSHEGLTLWRGNNKDKDGNISVSKSRVIDWRAHNTQLCNVTSEINANANHIFTGGVDFGRTDDCATGYIMTVGSIGGTNNPYLVATLQESEDNVVFTDVARFQNAETSNGTYYLTGKCTKRYRRFKLSVYGTNPTANNIVIRTENNLRFGEPFAFHDNYGKITNLIEYGAESNKMLWIFREGMIHSTTTQNNAVDEINLKELATLSDEWNGSVAITHNVHLYFSWVNGIQKYYNSGLDSDGPDLDAGLPPERQGRIVSMVSYPSRYFAAVQGKEVSSVLMKNNAGWHEIYRANWGKIHDMVFQPVYGDRPDRLWIAEGGEIVGLVMPSKTVKAINDTHSEFTHESVLVSAWHYAGMMDIPKMWNSIKILSENLKADELEIEADYQIDDDPKWHKIDGKFTISPSQKLLLESTYGVSGKRLRYRLRMMTNNIKKTPRVKAVVLEAIGRVDVKYSYSFPYRSLEDDRNLSNEKEDMTYFERQAILDEWVDNVTALHMRCAYELFDNKRVYLEAVSLSNLRETEEGYLGRITANEI